MKKIVFFILSNLVLISLISAQENDVKKEKEAESISESIFNTQNQKKLHFGGYGQIDYN